MPEEGFYEEVLNTDSELFGGSNVGNGGCVSSRPSPKRNRRTHRGHAAALAVVAFQKR